MHPAHTRGGGTPSELHEYFHGPATVSALPLFRPSERPFGERQSTAAVPTSDMTDSERDAEIKELSPTFWEGERLAGEMTMLRPVRK